MVPLAENWWFWVLVAAALAAGAGFSGRYRALVARARGAAVRGRLVEVPADKALRPSTGFWDDLSWLVPMLGAWVALGPWTWGYDGAEGAIETAVITGGLVIVIALATIAFPALWTLEMVAGLWLVLAPWFVGYGDANGPVGLSDTIAGALIFALAIAALSAAQRALRPSPGAGAVGRLRRSPGDD